MTTLALPTRATARVAGWSLLTMTVSLIVVHGGAMAIAGDRVSGTTDVLAITDYYSHGGLVPLYWQHGLAMVLFFGLFVVAFYRYLRDKATSDVDKMVAGLGAIVALAVIPLGLVEIGLQAAMVKLASADAPQGLIGVFVAWDWIYNSFFYWLEVVWVGAFSLVALRTGSLPRWLSMLGLVIAGFHVFHSTVLMSGLADTTTLPGTALFLVWFIATGVHLVRVK